MVEIAGSLRSVFVGAGVAVGGEVADGGATFSSRNAGGDGVVAPAVVDATWSGESGSMGGVGMAWRGDTPSHGGIGVEGDWAEDVAGVLGGLVSCRVADGGVSGADSDNGEKVSLSFSSWSHNNSNSFRQRLFSRWY